MHLGPCIGEGRPSTKAPLVCSVPWPIPSDPLGFHRRHGTFGEIALFRTPPMLEGPFLFEKRCQATKPPTSRGPPRADPRLLPDIGSLTPKMTCDVVAAIAKARLEARRGTGARRVCVPRLPGALRWWFGSVGV